MLVTLQDQVSRALATLKDQVSEEHKGKTELTKRLSPSGSAAFSLSIYSCFVGANVSTEPWQALNLVK